MELQPTVGSGSEAFDSLAAVFAAGIPYESAQRDGLPIEAWAEIPFQALLAQPQGAAVAAVGAQGDLVVAGVPAAETPIDAGPPAPIGLARSTFELVMGERSLLAPFLQDSTLSEPVTWVSRSPDIAAVAVDGDAVVAVQIGAAILQASTSSGRFAQLSLEVVPGTMRLSRAALTIPIGASERVEAVVGVPGRLVNEAQLQFEVTAPSIARVTSDGTVTGLSEGVADLVVSGALGERRLPMVVHRPVAAMASDPLPGVLHVPRGGSIPLAAVLVDLAYENVPDAQIVWTIEDSSRVRLEQGAATGQGTSAVVGQEMS